jgi:hypothetical protein
MTDGRELPVTVGQRYGLADRHAVCVEDCWLDQYHTFNMR